MKMPYKKVVIVLQHKSVIPVLAVSCYLKQQQLYCEIVGWLGLKLHTFVQIATFANVAKPQVHHCSKGFGLNPFLNDYFYFFFFNLFSF